MPAGCHHRPRPPQGAGRVSIDTDLWTPADTAPVTDFERMPPANLDAEVSVLGGMMLHPHAIGEVLDGPLEADDFYRPAHAIVYGAITALYAKGEPVDPITVTNELRETGLLDRVGGITAASDLVQQTPSAAHAGYYADIVHGAAKLRRITQAGTRITQLGYAGGDPDETADAAQTELNNAIQTSEDPDSAPIGDDFDQMVDELVELGKNGAAMGVPTGFADLDELLKGLHPGQMVIIAARPAMGKSTLAVDFLRSCSIKHQQPSVLFSLEMSRREVQHRIMSAEARVALHHIRGGNMTDSDWARFAQRLPDVTAAPITIDATSTLTMTQIKARARKIKQRSGLALVVIDYLQLVSSGNGRRAENRQQEVSDMSRAIKLMAKDLEVPVVVLAQLNRGPEQRQDKKPTKSDLRESGSLEQDADVVILLHREDAYEKDSARAGEVDLIVDKHRNGPTAVITVAAQLHYSRFVDMAQV
ncbi:replicative DNA helicase [Streptomyces californicus]|uniref:replicative DNA helicase n=1 Tax=Streptomyces californicus TaxID=67351 RepID=UPI003813E9CE